MTKKEILNELTEARAAHVKWHAYAQALAMGVDSGNEKLPQLYTDCTFGKWYYGHGNALKVVPTYADIEKIHEEVHLIYMEIYQKYLEPEKKGLFKRSTKKEELKEMVEKLKKASEIMIMKLDELEGEVKQMSDEKIASLFD